MKTPPPFEVDDTFSANLTNKKGATTNYDIAKNLTEQAYRFPDHWANPARVRRFVAWDGEGITYPTDERQSYVLFGASTGDRIIKPSLGSSDCFDLLLAVEATYPDSIHVGFAVQYDCNMMFKDFERRHLFQIYRHHKVHWNGYKIEYRPGKWLNIKKGRYTARLFDVWGFFQSRFVTACEKFLGADDPELVRIREGKQARSSFTYDQLETFIVPYWEAELRLLVRLMDSLREDLNSAGLPVRSWHGPGAVANTVFRINQIGLAKAETPKEVNRAAQYAYAGGRFELFKCGNYEGPVWEYDINSAYPAGIVGLPRLSAGTWRMVESFIPGSFGIWYIRYDDTSLSSTIFTKPHPLFHRDKHGNVSFPPITTGWYYTPEAAFAPDSVTHGYVFEPDDPDDKPFAFVAEMYERRQEWKSQGNSAEKALKLALNSLYGKMAQRTGWMTEGDPIPRWHQLEWAGHVTSTTRAKLWNAICSVPASNVIAAETDALFCTAPLFNLKIGKDLGSWEESRFDSLCYLQSGMYYGMQEGKLVEKYRGFDKGSLPYDKVLAHLRDYDNGIRTPLYGNTTRFIGMGIGLFTRKQWCSWDTDRKVVNIGGGGKRAHVPSLCPECKTGLPISENFHTLAVTTPGGESYPHRLPWLESCEPALRELDELERW